MSRPPRTLLVSILTVTALKGLGTLLGVLVAVGVANLFGAAAATDAYFLARRIIMNLGMAMERAFQLLQVPPLVSQLRENGPAAVYKVLNHQRRMVLLVSLVATAVVFVFARPILSVMAPGFDAAQTDAAAYYFRIMLLTIPIAAVTALTGAALNALRVFSLPVAARLLPRVLIVAALALVPFGFGLDLLSWAAVAGTLVMGTVFAVAVRRAFSGEHPPPAGNGATGLPGYGRARIVAMLLAQLHLVGASWVDMGFASLAGVGGVATLEFGQRLVNMAPGMVTNSVVTVYYTEFAIALGAGESERFRELVRDSLRTTLFMVLPIAAALLVFSGDVVRVLLEHGAFDAEATRRTEGIVAILAPLLPVNAILGTLTAAIFADAGLRHVRIILLSIVAAMAARVAVDLALIDRLGVVAVPIGAFVGMLVLLVVLFAALTMKRGAPIRLNETGPFLSLAAATAGASAVMWGARTLLTGGAETRIALAVDVVLAVAAGGLAFLLLAAALHLPEVGLVRRRAERVIRRLIGRSTGDGGPR